MLYWNTERGLKENGRSNSEKIQKLKLFYRNVIRKEFFDPCEMTKNSLMIDLILLKDSKLKKSRNLYHIRAF